MREVLPLPKCLCSSQMPGMRFAENLLCGIKLAKRGTRTVQLQVSKRQTKVRFAVAGLKLQGGLEIFR